MMASLFRTRHYQVLKCNVFLVLSFLFMLVEPHEASLQYPMKKHFTEPEEEYQRKISDLGLLPTLEESANKNVQSFPSQTTAQPSSVLPTTVTSLNQNIFAKFNETDHQLSTSELAESRSKKIPQRPIDATNLYSTETSHLSSDEVIKVNPKMEAPERVKDRKIFMNSGDHQMYNEVDSPIISNTENEIDGSTTNDLYNRNKNVVRASSEIISLKSKPKKFLAILKLARESSHFEDPFSISSSLNGEAFNKVLATDASSFSEDNHSQLRSVSTSTSNRTRKFSGKSIKSNDSQKRSRDKFGKQIRKLSASIDLGKKHSSESQNTLSYVADSDNTSGISQHNTEDNYIKKENSDGYNDTDSIARKIMTKINLQGSSENNDHTNTKNTVYTNVISIIHSNVKKNFSDIQLENLINRISSESLSNTTTSSPDKDLNRTSTPNKDLHITSSPDWNLTLSSNLNRNLSLASGPNKNLNLLSSPNGNLNFSSSLNRDLNLTSVLSRDLNLTSSLNKNRTLSLNRDQNLRSHDPKYTTKADEPSQDYISKTQLYLEPFQDSVPYFGSNNATEGQNLNLAKKNISETIPIYEEISEVLHIDSSIDDIQEFDTFKRVTENSEQLLPKINTSRINLLEPDLNNVNDKQLKENRSMAEQYHSHEMDSERNTSHVHSINHTLIGHDGIVDESGSPASLNSSSSLYPSQRNNITNSRTTVQLSGSENMSFEKLDKVNNTYANFIKNETAYRIRTSGTAKEASFEQDQREENPRQKKAQTSSYSFFGYKTEADFTQKRSNATDSKLLAAHSERVLDAQTKRMLQVMNISADPCDDFYEYACGKWSEVFPLGDKALDNTFDRLREGLDEVLRSILEEPISESNNKATKSAKILYKGCMNEDQIEKLGNEPLKTLLNNVGGWPVLEGDSWNETAFDWVALMATLRTYNNDILLSEWVAADVTNSSNHIIQLDQPELGLPGREYYISLGDQAYRKAYMELMLQSCHLLGGHPTACLEDMLNVLHFEKQLAKILTPAEERRNLSAVHQRLTVAELSREVPEINWHRYLSIVTGDSNTVPNEVIVFAMKYIRKLVELIKNTSKKTVGNYLMWRFIKNRISNLGSDALVAKQEFIQVLFGSKAQPERWLSCVSYVNGNLGYVVGSLFVKKYYPESSKNDSEEMIQLIRESFIESIRNATWMAESTRIVAEQKVLAMVRNVGYPEHILNETYMDSLYLELNFNESEHFWNVIQMLQFHARSTHNLLHIPVNRTEWTTTPAVVNAYYSRSKNMIMFPAGILQPPFYHPTFPKSLNFGGIGVVIGHEISHGFDDRGRQFDEKGNLQQWWTEDDVSHFYDRATCMLDQYGEYTVDSIGLKINAVNTLGENIADNAGLKIAFNAFHRWKQLHGVETKPLRDIELTYDQLFFLNFGQIWCEVNSPEAMLTKIRGGQHSPNVYRVIGTLSNSEEFSKAFHCPKGSRMNPEEKCQVW